MRVITILTTFADTQQVDSREVAEANSSQDGLEEAATVIRELLARDFVTWKSIDIRLERSIPGA